MGIFSPQPDVVPLMIASLAFVPACILAMILYIVIGVDLVLMSTVCFLILFLIGCGVFIYYEPKKT